VKTSIVQKIKRDNSRLIAKSVFLQSYALKTDDVQVLSQTCCDDGNIAYLQSRYAGLLGRCSSFAIATMLLAMQHLSSVIRNAVECLGNNDKRNIWFPWKALSKKKQ